MQDKTLFSLLNFSTVFGTNIFPCLKTIKILTKYLKQHNKSKIKYLIKKLTQNGIFKQ